MTFSPAPPHDALDRVDEWVRARGYAVLSPSTTAQWSAVAPSAFETLTDYWQDLPADPHLRDGGHYRYRRHASLIVDGDVRVAPPRAHWQSEDYNALHGGIERWFPPVDPTFLTLAPFVSLISTLASFASRLRSPQPWFTEVHQFRIDTADGIGRPTPEGAHRDGVDFVAVMLVRRVAIKGGETRLFDANGPMGLRFTMVEPWSLILLDDQRVVHETTPIQPTTAALGFRDTLVVTLRAGGFMAP